MSTAADLDVSVLDELDFAPPCGASDHHAMHPDQPASWFVSRICSKCKRLSEGFRCDWVVQRVLLKRAFWCLDCGKRCETDDPEVLFQATHL